MKMFSKLFLSLLLASFLLSSFLTFVECSSNEQNHKNIKHNANKVNHRMEYDITVHGILLWISMGFLMPIGILTIRFSNNQECGQRLELHFYLHAIIQMVAVLLATAGAILSVKSFENSFNNAHQRIGLALYGAIWIQAAFGFRRPKRGSKGRRIWFCFHWIFGTTISLIGILNTYIGLKAYHKRTSKPIKLWTILFATQISFMALFYLFQDKWSYLQKQGVISRNDQNTPSNQILPQSDQEDNNHANKEVLSQVQCPKNNALSSYFAKSNALKKLLQLSH